MTTKERTTLGFGLAVTAIGTAYQVYLHNLGVAVLLSIGVVYCLVELMADR